MVQMFHVFIEIYIQFSSENGLLFYKFVHCKTEIDLISLFYSM